jgi:cyanophycinase
MNVTRAAVLVAALLAPASARAGQRVVLFGGGAFPKEAVDLYMRGAGGEKAHVLFVTWASGEPREEIEEFKTYMEPWKIVAPEVAPSTSTIMARKREFLEQLSRATGVFFTGGDQNRIMNVLDKDPALAEALRKRYREGVVFGGTSAGTALMSKIMITGEGNFEVIDGTKVETRTGLGLLPPDVIVDQHFIRRQRENRLFGLVLTFPGTLGAGVDEPCALVVDDVRYAQAFGPTHVMIVRATSPSALAVELLKSGERYDLRERKRL